jgi:hypothetical protein
MQPQSSDNRGFSGSGDPDPAVSFTLYEKWLLIVIIFIGMSPNFVLLETELLIHKPPVLFNKKLYYFF